MVEACDAWLTQGMHHSREQLGEHWLNAYLNAPLWRFEWPPGVINERWWLGVMMPSVDRVGRYFPLVIAREAHAQFPRASLHGWYDKLSDAALQTLTNEATLAQFEAALLAAQSHWPKIEPQTRNAGGATHRARWWLDPASFRVRLPVEVDGLPEPRWFSRMLLPSPSDDPS